jgi:RNA recognition motif-containing protein
MRVTRKLFVGGLAWATDNSRLAGAFSEFGEVEEARVIVDRESGQSKGFGFVTMDTPEAAEEAIKVLNDSMLDGRRVRVSEANDNGRERRGRGTHAGGFSGAREVAESRSRQKKTDLPQPEIIQRKRPQHDDGTGGSRQPRKMPWGRNKK